MTRASSAPAAVQARALVLGIEHPRALAVVRSLGRRGIRVVGVERDPAARGRGSRYLQDVVMVEGGRLARSPRWKRWLPIPVAGFAEGWRASFRQWVAGTVLPRTSVRGMMARRFRRRPIL